VKNGVKHLKLTEEPNDVQVSSGLLPFILWHFTTKLGNMCFRGISILGGGGAESLPPQEEEAFFFVFAFKICLPHQSVMPFFSDACLCEKNPGSSPSLCSISTCTGF